MRELQEDRARGLMLGLLLGDANDEFEQGRATVHGTCLAQLACFTLEGLVRASMRFEHHGLCHPPSVVWHAWCRWAAIQQLGPTFAEHWSSGTSGLWPDGWLAQVKPLSVRRGSAPATVTALRRSPSPPDKPQGSSAGHHALTRGLPVAIFSSVLQDPSGLASDLARLTHGSPDAWLAASEGAALAARLVHGESVDLIRSPAAGRSSAPGTALHALHHGVVSASQADDLETALALASAHGPGAATVAGAVFGAARGVGALPSWWVSRLEIGWVADRLARDAFAEIVVRPGGSEYTEPDDPTWWARYPGW